MDDGIMLFIDADGVAKEYNDDFDLTIHCESKEEQDEAIRRLSQKWIPCSERLPDDSGKYFVTVLDGVGRRTTTALYRPLLKSWGLTGCMAYWKVIAWQELPESWKG